VTSFVDGVNIRQTEAISKNRMAAVAIGFGLRLRGNLAAGMLGLQATV
jgi:hypothetical protein